jgi:hypothetical protein
MYYTQFLANQAEQVTISRVAARLDAVAADNQLKSPFQVTFIGNYAPANKRFTRFDTIGASPLYWGNGSIERQAALFHLYGVDGIVINADDVYRREIASHIQRERIPSWPDPRSVFMYKNAIVVVNFGKY